MPTYGGWDNALGLTPGGRIGLSAVPLAQDTANSTTRTAENVRIKFHKRNGYQGHATSTQLVLDEGHRSHRCRPGGESLLTLRTEGAIR